MAALELRNRCRAIPRLSGQQNERDFGGVQFFLDQLEHAGELGENQDAPAFVDQLGEHFHQPFKLGGPGLDRLDTGGLDQSRIAADLPQLQQRVEELDPAAVQALGGDGVTDLAVHREADAVIEGALAAAEFNLLDDFGLRRQVGGHGGLSPTQQEWLHTPGQALLPLHIALFLDRASPGFHEALVVTEKTGRDEVEQRP